MSLVINANLNTTSMNALKTADPTTYNNYVADIQTAINFFQSHFANPVQININFEWGQVTSYNSTVVTFAPGAGVYGAENFNWGRIFTYTQVKNALAANDTHTVEQQAAVASLPSTDPTNGATFYLTNGEVKALGLTPAISPDGSDDHVGIGAASLPNGSQLNAITVSALEHEISEAMGRLAIAGGSAANGRYSPLDLFRYQAADGLATDPIGAAADARDLAPADHFSYFSYDGKTVTLPFSTPTQVTSTQYDVGDWNTIATNDAFAARISGPNIVVSPTDMQVMNVLGWQLGSGLIDVLTVNEQLELIYLGYFNRSAESGGFSFWEGQNAHAQAPPSSGGFGQSAAVALTNIANSFTPQPETIATYPFLGNANVNLADPAVQAQVSTLISNVYQNLFNHAPDGGGAAYWLGQLTSGTIPLGKAILAIANGATGADAIILENKIAVALDFTTLTTAANLPANAALLAEAKTVLSGIDGLSFNDASVTAAEALIAPWIASQPHPVSLVGVAQPFDLTVPSI